VAKARRKLPAIEFQNGVTTSVPFDPALEANRPVFDYIKNCHAHSDIVEPLIAATKPLGDAQIFSPGDYRYVTVSTSRIIFGFAIGTNVIAFRLNGQMKERAIITGGAAFPLCGSDWVSFEPFRCEWPRVDFEFWALKAYVRAREMAGLA
jgi:hypothetical protein